MPNSRGVFFDFSGLYLKIVQIGPIIMSNVLSFEFLVFSCRMCRYAGIIE
jgi:hypothetical protein